MQRMFSAEAFTRIETLVQRGLTRRNAQQIGCTTGTLRVMCSKRGISLRQGERPIRTPVRLVLRLHPATAAGLARTAAERQSTVRSCSASAEDHTVRDNLISAVIDG